MTSVCRLTACDASDIVPFPGQVEIARRERQVARRQDLPGHRKRGRQAGECLARTGRDVRPTVFRTRARRSSQARGQEPCPSVMTTRAVPRALLHRLERFDARRGERDRAGQPAGHRTRRTGERDERRDVEILERAAPVVRRLTLTAIESGGTREPATEHFHLQSVERDRAAFMRVAVSRLVNAMPSARPLRARTAISRCSGTAAAGGAARSPG